VHVAWGQVFAIDTISYNGSTDHLINLVIMGDGYTADEQTKFVTDATNFSHYLFATVPYVNYKNYFNIFAIKVISEESGTRHPNTASDCSSASPLVPVSNPKTFFGCTFDYDVIQRLMYPTNFQNIYSVLVTNFPNYDQVIIIANSPYYGGGGGEYAATTTHPYAAEVVTHEMGHSFGGLEDEYESGIDFEAPNQSKVSDPATVRWKNWIGSNDIDIYKKGATDWYRPHQNCKMRYLNRPFCSVCTEAIIERIHILTDPVRAFSPVDTLLVSTDSVIHFAIDLIKPEPNTLSTLWRLDGEIVAGQVDSFHVALDTLPLGDHTFNVLVTDTSSMLRVYNHSSLNRHFSLINWRIKKASSGVHLSGEQDYFMFEVSPNPMTSVLNIKGSTEKARAVSISLMSVDGNQVSPTLRFELHAGDFERDIDVSRLLPGIYVLNLQIDNQPITVKLIKIK